MTDDNDDPSGDDSKKLIPEWGRPADEQVIWIGLVALLLGALVFFGGFRFGDGDGDGDGATGDRGGTDASQTVDELIEADDDLSATADLFDRAEIDGELGDAEAGPFTVFAPTNAAWEDAAEASDLSVDELLGGLDDAAAEEGVGFHVVEGELTLSDLADEGTVTTIGGAELSFDDDLIDGVIEIEEADIETANGVVHKIRGVLPVQPEPEPAPTTTVPAPTTTVPPPATTTPAPTTTAPAPTTTLAPVTIGSLAGETPELSSLTGVIAELGLDAELTDPAAGPFTVFAPDDDAFSSSAQVLASLTDDDVRQTIDYHVVPGVVPSSEVVPGATFETLSGDTLVVGSDGSLPGNISVLAPDLETDNGVVHVIDGVMIPPEVALRELTSRIAAFEGIQFDVGSAAIRPESEPILREAAAVLLLLPEGTRVEVGGHTDADGGASGNQQLSEARAGSVVAFLVGEGVDATLLSAVGYGEDRPLVTPEVTDADKQANRRIEFTISDA